MYDKLKKFIELIQEADKEQTIHFADPEEMRKFELKWKLIHQEEDRLIQGAKLLLEKKEVE
jgi:hypothetical protein